MISRSPRLKALAATAVVGACLGLAGIASGQAPLPSHTTPNAPGSLTYPERGLSTPPPVPDRLTSAELQALWVDAGDAYGIPWQILGSINRIETNYGTNMGPSSAGAVGWMQFIPSTWERWGLDADGDGIADPWDPDDAVYSASRYLAATGGQTDLRRAIFAYNHAEWYVNDVIELAQELDSTGELNLNIPIPAPAPGPIGSVFEVDDLDERRGETTEEVREAQKRINDLKGELSVLRKARAKMRQAAGNTEISDASFIASEAEITGLEAREDEMKAELAQMRRNLQGSLGRLASVEQEADATTFWRPLSSPVIATSAGGQVSPVLMPAGMPITLIGRPGHGTHNQSDWQSANAVDFAAPPGTPVVATEDGVITRVSGQDASLGTRATASGKKIYGYSVTLAGTSDTYFYAHVSEVVAFPGQQVKAGQVIATISEWPGGAPHLHFGVRNGSPEAIAEASPASAAVRTPNRLAKRPTPSEPVFEVLDEDDDVITFVRGG